jgi:hypothetical protein
MQAMMVINPPVVFFAALFVAAGHRVIARAFGSRVQTHIAEQAARSMTREDAAGG